MTGQESAALTAFRDELRERFDAFELRIEGKVERALTRVDTLERERDIERAVNQALITERETNAGRHKWRVEHYADWGLRLGGLILAALTAMGKVHI